MEEEKPANWTPTPTNKIKTIPALLKLIPKEKLSEAKKLLKKILYEI